jgi:hypothetical protein
MNLVFLYGAPAVGKLTVARSLAALTGYPVFHNHVAIDAVKPVFDFGEGPFWKLVNTIRVNVLEAAAEAGKSVITTFVYAGGTSEAQDMCAAFERHGGRICLVQLVCDMRTNEQRILMPERADLGKAHTVERLHQAHSRWDFSTQLPGRKSLLIDNSVMSPADVASEIQRHFGLPTAEQRPHPQSD